jgi:hypothetical protein
VASVNSPLISRAEETFGAKRPKRTEKIARERVFIVFAQVKKMGPV